MTPGRRLFIATAVLLAVLVIGPTGYIVLEKLSVLDAIYMTLVTVSTVGMASRELGDSLDQAGKVWTIALIFFGVGTVTVAFSSLMAMVAGGEIRRILGRRQLNAKISAMRDHVIVCGFGRVGRLVCQGLAENGRPFVVIDRSEAATAEAERLGYTCLLGDATEEETLQTGGLDRARALVAVLAGDADNVYVTLTARSLREGITIVAAAQQPATDSKLRRAGATRVVCPQVLGATHITDVLTRPAIVDFYEMATQGVDLEMEQVLVTAGSELAGKNLREARLRDRFGVLVVAVRKADGQTVYNPAPDSVLEVNDLLVVIGPGGSAAGLRKLQHVGLAASPIQSQESATP